MRRSLAIGICFVFLAAGGYYLYRDPRVRDLFRPVTPRPRTLRERAASRMPPRPGSVAPRRQPKPAPVPGPVVEPEPEMVPNQTPNATVARVLTQIIAAKRIGEDIRLVVSDREVIVTGTVDTSAQREEILETIGKGREARRIDASGLTVRQ